MTEPTERRAGWLKRKLSRAPIWISVPVLLVVALGGGAVALIILFFGAFYFLLCLPDEWARARLEPEMAAAGVAALSANEINSNFPHPASSSTSPDGLWSVAATWSSSDHGYDWTLRNNKTGQIYPQGYRVKDSCWSFLPQVSFLWSPDGRYLAVNSISENAVHLDVLSVTGAQPEYLGRDPGAIAIEDRRNMGLESGDASAQWNVQSMRSRALRWTNDTNLECVLYVDEFESEQPNEVQTAAHVTFHFEGDSFTVTTTHRDFCERLITDL